MRPFRRRQGRVYAAFDAYEAQLITTFARQLIELLSEDTPQADTGDPLEQLLDLDGPVSAPDDPVLARLLPEGYREDEEGAVDFRRFTERSLRQGKIRNAQVLMSTLDTGVDLDTDSEPDPETVVEVELDAEAVEAWLRALNDIRLALGTRLGVEEDDAEHWESMSDENPQAVVHDIYDWLGLVQESLVQALG